MRLRRDKNDWRQCVSIQSCANLVWFARSGTVCVAIYRVNVVRCFLACSPVIQYTQISLVLQPHLSFPSKTLWISSRASSVWWWWASIDTWRWSTQLGQPNGGSRVSPSWLTWQYGAFRWLSSYLLWSSVGWTRCRYVGSCGRSLRTSITRPSYSTPSSLDSFCRSLSYACVTC